MVLYVRLLLQFLLYLYLLTFVCVFETTARWLARFPLSLRSILQAVLARSPCCPVVPLRFYSALRRSILCTQANPRSDVRALLSEGFLD